MVGFGSSRPSLATLLLAILTTSGSARAEGIERTRARYVGTGWFDFNRKESETLDARVEYRGRVIRPLRGIAVRTMRGDSSVFLGAGIGYELALGRRCVVAPTFAPAYYQRGDGKDDLGDPLEFRSQLEHGYEFGGGSRLSVAISHLSRAGLGWHNPGQESLTVACEIPLTRRPWGPGGR
jgi:lipid A 3-O-deacylase